jgi:hypothetical protein
MRRWILVICGGLVLPVALSGCSDVRHAFGLEKTVPNEFDVVENAPLAIPPDFNLRPPRPGVGPSQAVSSETQAKETIFRAGGNSGGIAAPDSQFSAGEQDILRAAGAQTSPGDIRQVVNQEAAEGQPFNRNFVQRLLDHRPNKEQQKAVLDPVKETARLEDRNAAANTVTHQFSSPPTVERKSDSSSFLDRLF